jgi:hypothetical protein
VNTGYDIDRLATATVDLVHPRDTAQSNYTTLSGMRVGLPELAERIRRLPDVENAGVTTAAPLAGGLMPDVFVPGFDSLPEVGTQPPGIAYVSPEYLPTVGVRVLDGRGITRDDRAGSEPVALVNATMAKALWPGERAIDKCVRVERRDSPCRRVVGVVSDQKGVWLVEESSMHVFVPFLQVHRPSRFTTYIVIRARPERLAFATEEMHHELLRVFTGTRTQWLRVTVPADRIPSELRPWQLSATIFATAGVLALLVASIGVYSVISYTFGQRTHEIGIRIALGATGPRVAGLVVGQGVRIVAAGVCIGAAIALALGRVVASALYGTTPRDPVVLIGSALTLTVVAVIACMVPARRAVRVDPIQALRTD